MALLGVLADIKYWVVASIVVAFALGSLGDWVPNAVILVLMLQMIAAMQGLTFRKDDFKNDAKPIVWCVVCCFVVSTVLTLGVGLLFKQESEGLWYGWAMLASVPAGVSIIALTLLYKGDRVLSVLALVVVYLVALGVTPALTSSLIGDAVSPMEILKYVVLFIAVPLLANIPLKKVKFNQTYKVIFINAMMFLLLVFSVGNNRDYIMDEVGMVVLIILACLVRTFGVSLAILYLGKRRGGDRARYITYMGYAVWKNSGLATSMCLVLLSGFGEAALPCCVSLMVENVWYAAMTTISRKVWPVDESRTAEAEAKAA